MRPEAKYRNIEIERTAPYMHDGSIATLEDVVNFYAVGGHRNPALDVRMQPIDLNAFLKTLSGEIREGQIFWTLDEFVEKIPLLS